MIIVRRATLEDREAILKFLQMVYKDRWQYKYPERWQWEYVDNPFLEGKELPIFIAIDESGSVVGQNCTLVEPLQIAGRECRVGWSVDLYLLPEYRGQGIGFQLHKANGDTNPFFMSLDMSLASRRLKAGLGWAPVDPVVLYTRLVRFEPESVLAAVTRRLTSRDGSARKFLSLLLHGLLFDRAVSALLNGALAVRDFWQLRKKADAPVLQPVEKFGEEVNRLWAKISPRYTALVKRDDKYLNWKYFQQPFMEYLPFLAKRGEEVCGYLILRLGKPPERFVGVIADVFAAPEDEATIFALLRYALRYFIKAKVKDVMAASSLRSYQRCYEALGFKRTKEVFPMLRCKGEGPECKAALEPGAWFLSKGDHDWDQYPLAR